MVYQITCLRPSRRISAVVKQAGLWLKNYDPAPRWIAWLERIEHSISDSRAHLIYMIQDTRKSPRHLPMAILVDHTSISIMADLSRVFEFGVHPNETLPQLLFG